MFKQTHVNVPPACAHVLDQRTITFVYKCCTYLELVYKQTHVKVPQAGAHALDYDTITFTRARPTYNYIGIQTNAEQMARV